MSYNPRSAFFLLLASVITGFAQSPSVNYSTGGTNVPGYTGFFNSNDGWNNTGDPLWEGQKGWTGTGSGADSVSVISGVTPTNTPGNASGTLGVFVNTFPLNTTNVYVERAFAPAPNFALTNATVSVVAEWSLLDFDSSSSAGESDTFVIDFRNVANTASILRFQMNTNGITSTNYNYLVSSVGSSDRAQFETTFGALMRMQVDLTDAGTFSGSYSLVDPATRTNILLFDPVTSSYVTSIALNSGLLAPGFIASDFGTLRLGWQLADGANNPGLLGIAVNEFTIVSTGTVIPEPGTWAAAAALGLGAIFVNYRRRRAASMAAIAR